MNTLTSHSLILFAFFILSNTASAVDVKITQSMEFLTAKHKGTNVRIERIQDQSNHLTGGFAKTSRKCPPFCIQPMTVAPGVVTYGELELIRFIKDYVNTSKGVLIDARTPSWHAKGTIPGSINIPFTTFALKHDDAKLITSMKLLGVERRKGVAKEGFWVDLKDTLGIEKKPHPLWNFSSAKQLLLWCNGMWCGQSPRAIKGLIKLGYPAEKLHYYRAGMQAWQILGLTVSVPETPAPVAAPQ
jgi:rhodanese-related sulfurtransferase